MEWQSVYGWIVIGLLTAVLSYFSCYVATIIAKRSGLIAHPGERQSHTVATPAGGGLGIIFSLVVASLCLQWVVFIPDFWWQKMLPGIVLLAAVGWRDDKLPVSSLIRLLVQLTVSLWLLGYGWFEISLTGAGLFAIAVLAMIWMMNLYNFMDGSNGMAGFQGVFAGLAMAVIFHAGDESAMALIALAVAAGSAGFLPLNFPRARVFMGDVASVPLGFIFAAFAVYGVQSGALDLPVAILIMSVFIVDSTMTLVARVFRGERWYTAHAQHVYQRLIAQGWSHRKVLMIYQVINVILVLPAILLAEIYPQYAIVAAGLTMLILGVCWHIANRRLGMFATAQIK